MQNKMNDADRRRGQTGRQLLRVQPLHVFGKELREPPAAEDRHDVILHRLPVAPHRLWTHDRRDAIEPGLQEVLDRRALVGQGVHPLQVALGGAQLADDLLARLAVEVLPLAVRQGDVRAPAAVAALIDAALALTATCHGLVPARSRAAPGGRRRRGG
jgi:hypothetical protein